MSRTTFRNASGWPDPDQITTARDLALLARHLIQDYPSEYRYFSVPYFTFHGRYIPNHDRMLQTYPGADGLKTGYIDASGCNLVTSAVRGDVRLIGVVMGAINGAERDSHMAALLDAGFERMGVPVSREPQYARAPAAMVAGTSLGTLQPSTLYNPRTPVRLANARAAVVRMPSAPRQEMRMVPVVIRPHASHYDLPPARPAARPAAYNRSAATALRAHS